MLERYVSDLVIKNCCIEEIKFDWSIAQRPFLKTINEASPQLAALLVGRFSALESISVEWAFCGLLEKVLEVEVSQRTQRIRVLLAELQRTIWGFNYISNILESLGDSFNLQMSRSALDQALSLQERLTGGRILPQAFEIGGVRRDISEGDCKKIRDVSSSLLDQLQELIKRTEKDSLFTERLKSGVKTTREIIEKEDIYGPLAFSLGLERDLRYGVNASLGNYGYVHCYSMSNRLEAKVFEGSSFERFVAVYWQTLHALEIMQKMSQEMPPGSHWVSANIPESFASLNGCFSVQAPSGKLTCLLSNGVFSLDSTTLRLQSYLPRIFFGEKVSDWELSFFSLGLDVAQGAI